MTLKKQTIVDQIEILRGGHIQLRFSKQVVDGDRVLASEFHRTSIEAGGDIAKQMAAVNLDLTRQGFEPIAPAELANIPRHAAIAWKPGHVADYEKKMAAELKPHLEHSAAAVAAMYDAIEADEAELERLTPLKKITEEKVAAAAEELRQAIAKLLELRGDKNNADALSRQAMERLEGNDTAAPGDPGSEANG